MKFVVEDGPSSASTTDQIKNFAGFLVWSYLLHDSFQQHESCYPTNTSTIYYRLMPSTDTSVGWLNNGLTYLERGLAAEDYQQRSASER